MERTRTKPGGTHHQEMGRREEASEGTRRGRAKNILGVSGRKYIVGEGYAQCSDRSSKVGLRATMCSSWEIAGSRDKRSFGGLVRQTSDRNELLGKWKEGSRESPCGQHFAAKMSKATDEQLTGEGNQGDLCLPFQDGESAACLYAAGNDLLLSDSLIVAEAGRGPGMVSLRCSTFKDPCFPPLQGLRGEHGHGWWNKTKEKPAVTTCLKLPFSITRFSLSPHLDWEPWRDEVGAMATPWSFAPCKGTLMGMADHLVPSRLLSPPSF